MVKTGTPTSTDGDDFDAVAFFEALSDPTSERAATALRGAIEARGTEAESPRLRKELGSDGDDWEGTKLLSVCRVVTGEDCCGGFIGDAKKRFCVRSKGTCAVISHGKDKAVIHPGWYICAGEKRESSGVFLEPCLEMSIAKFGGGTVRRLLDPVAPPRFQLGAWRFVFTDYLARVRGDASTQVGEDKDILDKLFGSEVEHQGDMPPGANQSTPQEETGEAGGLRVYTNWGAETGQSDTSYSPELAYMREGAEQRLLEAFSSLEKRFEAEVVHRKNLERELRTMQDERETWQLDVEDRVMEATSSGTEFQRMKGKWREYLDRAAHRIMDAERRSMDPRLEERVLAIEKYVGTRQHEREPEAIRERVVALERETFGSHGALPRVIQEVGLLREQAGDVGLHIFNVKCGSQLDFYSWIKARLPLGNYGLFVDAVSLLQSIDKEVVSFDTAMSTQGAVEKAGLTKREAVIQSSFRTLLPSVLATGSSGDPTTAGLFGKAMKSFDAWKSPGSVLDTRSRIEEGTRKLVYSMRNSIRAEIDNEDARELAREMLDAAERFISTFV